MWRLTYTTQYEHRLGEIGPSLKSLLNRAASMDGSAIGMRVYAWIDGGQADPVCFTLIKINGADAWIGATC